MAKVKKRKPDLRRIRPTKTYTLPEIAETLSRDIATVRRWLRVGLPTLDDQKPTLVDGTVLRLWLKAERASRKCKCAPDELYCLKCRTGRKPEPGSVSFRPRNAKTLSIKAICPTCGSRMNKGASLVKRAEIESRFSAFMPGMQRLAGCGDTSVGRTEKQPPLTAANTGAGGGPISTAFGSGTGGHSLPTMNRKKKVSDRQGQESHDETQSRE